MVQFLVDDVPVLVEVDDARIDGDVVQFVQQVVVSWGRPPAGAGVVHARTEVDQLRDVVNDAALESEQEVEFGSRIRHFQTEGIVGHLLHDRAHAVEDDNGGTHGVQCDVELPPVLLEGKQMTSIVVEKLRENSCAVIIDVGDAVLFTDISVEKLSQIISNTVLPRHESVQGVVEIADVVFPLFKGAHQLRLRVVFKMFLISLHHEPVRIEDESLVVCALDLVVLVDGQGPALVVLIDLDDVVVGVVLVFPGRLSVEHHFHDVVVDVVHVLVRLEVARADLAPPLVDATQVVVLDLEREYHVVVEPAEKIVATVREGVEVVTTSFRLRGFHSQKRSLFHLPWLTISKLATTDPKPTPHLYHSSVSFPPALYSRMTSTFESVMLMRLARGYASVNVLTRSSSPVSALYVRLTGANTCVPMLTSMDATRKLLS